MGKLKRGFKTVRSQIEGSRGGMRSVRNCLSCIYLDTEEVCTNKGVTSYDFTEEEGKCYCSYWRITLNKEDKKER